MAVGEPQNRSRQTSTPVIRFACILAASFLLSACQAPQPKLVAEPQAEATGNGAVDDVRSEAINPEPPPTLEPEPPVLTCPEPEPVPECPPPPKPKPCPVCPESKLDGKMLLGAVEKIKLSPPDITYMARIDSGAEGSSIHATDIVRFERDGQKWVRFTLDNPGGDPVVMEKEVVRRVRVRQVDAEDFARRLVVIMTITIGSLTEQLEISLNDRSEMEYPVLIGRNFLSNNAIVDVSQDNIAK